MRGPSEGSCSFHQFPPGLCAGPSDRSRRDSAGRGSRSDRPGTPAPHRRCAVSGSAARQRGVGLHRRPAGGSVGALGGQRAEPQHVDADRHCGPCIMPDPVQGIEQLRRRRRVQSSARHHDDAPDVRLRAPTDTACRRRAAALRRRGRAAAAAVRRGSGACAGVQPVKRRKAAMPNELEEHRRDQQQDQAGTRLRAGLGRSHGRGRRKPSRTGDDDRGQRQAEPLHGVAAVAFRRQRIGQHVEIARVADAAARDPGAARAAPAGSAGSQRGDIDRSGSSASPASRLVAPVRRMARSPMREGRSQRRRRPAGRAADQRLLTGWQGRRRQLRGCPARPASPGRPAAPRPPVGLEHAEYRARRRHCRAAGCPAAGPGGRGSGRRPRAQS